jgi:hypothetical protein
VTDVLRRLRYWIESARRSEALREEMELHLAEKTAELEADGMTAERARAEARRRFGNVGLKQEESREIWMTRFLSELYQDVRYGVRTMIANKAFSALAVLSLALGIGANTTIYSFMESILLRSLPSIASIIRSPVSIRKLYGARRDRGGELRQPRRRWLGRCSQCRVSFDVVLCNTISR